MAESSLDRIVALEEHCTVPRLVAKLDPQRIALRGYPRGGSGGPMAAVNEKLQDLAEMRLRDMDAGGVTLQVLSQSGPGADLLEPADAPAWASEMNAALASAVSAHPDRFAAFAHLPLTSPEAAADELEACVTQRGFVGALVNGLTSGKFLDQPEFAPVLARAEKLDVPIYIHPGIPPKAVREAYYEGFDERASFMLATAGWGWHSETAIHILRLVLSGAFDRFPRLKVIVGHMGEGLAAMLDRCDHVFRNAGRSERSISEAILSHVWATTSGMFTSPPLLALIAVFGIDRVLFSVDYPYSANEQGLAFLRGLPLAPADAAKIAHENADRLLKLRRNP